MIIGEPVKVSLSNGSLEASVMKILDQVQDQAQLPIFVDYYINHFSGIEEDRFTPAVRQAMVEYLLERGATFEDIDDDLDELEKHDELFALAYENAIMRQSGREDPIDAAHQPGGG